MTDRRGGLPLEDLLEGRPETGSVEARHKVRGVRLEAANRPTEDVRHDDAIDT
jgi:hypothetical protein